MPKSEMVKGYKIVLGNEPAIKCEWLCRNSLFLYLHINTHFFFVILNVSLAFMFSTGRNQNKEIKEYSGALLLQRSQQMYLAALVTHFAMRCKLNSTYE